MYKACIKNDRICIHKQKMIKYALTNGKRLKYATKNNSYRYTKQISMSLS